MGVESISKATAGLNITWPESGDYFGVSGRYCRLGMLGRLPAESRMEAILTFSVDGAITWPIIGTALFASNISTVHMVSFAECGYKSGLLYGNFEWMAPFTLICLSLFFAPFYIRSGVTTLPDFLERR